MTLPLLDTGLLPPGETLAVAYSGGADSTALLHALAEEVGPERLLALHYNHGIRGAESDGDEAHCRETCAGLGVAFLCGRGDVPRAVREGGNLEAAARRLRYGWFLSVLRERGVHFLLTAHHADDVSETLLMHLLRGAGAAGLGGLRRRAAFKDLFPESGAGEDCFILRPLLGRTAAELRAYCAERELAFREDSTNGDTAYLRNWLRREVMPLLRTRGGEELPRRLARTAEILGDQQDCLKGEAEEFLRQAARLAPYGVLLDKAAFQGLAPALQREALRLLAPGDAEWEFKHVESLRHALAAGRLPGDFPPGGLRLADLGSRWLLHLAAPAGAERLLAYLARRLAARPVAGRGEGLSDSGEGLRRWLAGEGVLLRQYVRRGEVDWSSAREGQALRLVNGRTKKYQDLMTDARVPSFLRRALPLFSVAGELAWVPGFRVAAGAALRPGEEALELSLELPAAAPFERQRYLAFLKGEYPC